NPSREFYSRNYLKDQCMKKFRVSCFLFRFFALVVPLVCSHAHAISLDEIQFWTGNGTNRAAMVIHWSAPEVRNNTSVPNPVAEKSLVWGYRWNGTNNALQMFDTIVAADRRLFVAASDPFP